MKPLLVFRHIDCEGPGYFGTVLERYRIPWRLIRVDEGERIPSTLEGTSGLVFMGGPMSVNDSLPWIQDELALIRAAADRGLPVLGHCLGGQLISKALGGNVAANPVKEIGWHAVTRTDSAAATAWLNELPHKFDAFHWHGETFSLPAGAQPLLSSRFCRHQAFVLNNTLALQCHIEMTADMVREWAVRYRDETLRPDESVQSETQLTEHLEEKITKLHASADILYKRWLAALLRRSRV